jgi:hypothetical protein
MRFWTYLRIIEFLFKIVLWTILTAIYEDELIEEPQRRETIIENIERQKEQLLVNIVISQSINKITRVFLYTVKMSDIEIKSNIIGVNIFDKIQKLARIFKKQIWFRFLFLCSFFLLSRQLYSDH